MCAANGICSGLQRIGMYNDDKELQPTSSAQVPLVSVSINAAVIHGVGQVEVTQIFVNQEEQPIEAVYYFPVNSDGAVTHFQAELEGKILKGTVKAEDEANDIYENAVESRLTALLGEETKADIFKLRIGYLKPGSQVKVVIGYVTEVKNEPGSKAIRFYIPTTVAPRYVSPTENDPKAEDIKNMEFSSDSPAPLSIKVAVSLQGKIKSIDSPTHQVKTEKVGPISQNPTWEKALVQLSGVTTDMDQDFVLHILPEDAHKPRLYSEKSEDGCTTALMLHLVPSFKLNEQKAELIFVLDRSGSMKGESIELTKKALLLFLHSLPVDCYFNLVGFGNTFQFLFPESSKYDDGSLNAAINHAKDLEADLGGTEILAPLTEIYNKPIIPGFLRQIFVLTDGEVSNTENVLALARKNAHNSRVFALGIGDSASHYLVEGIAKAAGGTAAFVTYNESFEEKVMNQLKNALQPALTEVQLAWEGIESETFPEKVVVQKEKTLLGYNKPVADTEQMPTFKWTQSPKKIPPVYDGSQLLVFALFERQVPKAVTITAQSPDGPLSLRMELSPENELERTGMLLHRLAAVKLVRELELELLSQKLEKSGDIDAKYEFLKKQIIQTSCQHGIVSKYTSFVVVDSNNGEAATDCWVTMKTRLVPSQLVHGWHGRSARPKGSCLSAAEANLPQFRAMLKKRRYIKCDTMATSTKSGPPSQLEDLVALQKFDGSFELKTELYVVMNMSKSDITAAAAKYNVEEDIVATCLAIAYFTTELSAHKSLWELVVTKAEKWLLDVLSPERKEEIMQIAEDILKKN